MSETTETPSAASATPADAPAATAATDSKSDPNPDLNPATGSPGEAKFSETEAAMADAPKLNIRTLLECGVHFGHQTSRWNPRMRRYIFGERNGTHILDLDQTLPLFAEGLEFLREVTAKGGKVLFVGTKRQAAPVIESEARRSEQFYVNNRWLGGMLTNWKTVRKSIDRYKESMELRDDEEKRAQLSKKELARATRLCDKYHKSLAGIVEMNKLPQAVFIIDVSKEEIAVSEARRLGIPVVAVVDSNCNPEGIDFVVPGNDDALRSVGLYCTLVANACIEGAQEHQKKLVTEGDSTQVAAQAAAPATGRRVVEIKQPPRRGRGQAGGRTHSSGGWAERDAAAAPRAPDAAETPAAPSAPSQLAPDLTADARASLSEKQAETQAGDKREEE